MNHPYIFHDTQDQAEWERLRKLEEEYDPATRRLLLSLGLGAGQRCLEIGPGAGSVMRWMAEQVGPRGCVVAVDLNTRFVAGDQAPTIEVREDDIVAHELEEAAYDVVHARYVLMHIREWRPALVHMIRALRPGGWLLVEEADFGLDAAVSPDPETEASFGRVCEAVRRMYAAKHLDCRMGRRLPLLCAEEGLEEIGVEVDAQLVPGGSRRAALMRESLFHLRGLLTATGAASDGDLDRYAALCDDPASWAILHGKMSVWGRKRGA